MRYLHSMLRVGDLERARRFFVDLLGFVEVDRREVPAGRYTLLFLAAPDDAARARSEGAPMVELTWNWDESEYASGRSFGHLAYRVADVYAVCQRLADAGVTVNRPPRDGRMAFVRTPDGISIELLQDGAALPPREPWASAPNVGAW